MFKAKLLGFRKGVDQLIQLPSKAAGSSGAYLLAVLTVAVAFFLRLLLGLAKSLKDEEELRNLTVKELDHRLKNKVATIQAIIALQLRGNDTVREAIFQRLGALSSELKDD